LWQCAECDYIIDNDLICRRCLARYDTFRISLCPNYDSIDLEELGYDIEHNIFKLRCNRLDYLIGINRVNGVNEMTPQEELFAGFFRDEKMQIKDMSILEMRSHREELAKIAFEARARLTAVDDEERERKSKARKESGVTGFSTSLQTDELTSNAINKIKDRTKKLNKQEKTLQGLIKMGMDPKDAEKLMSAGTILARVRATEQKSGKEPEAATSFNNPFKPQTEELAQLIEVAISEETTTVVITKTEPEPIQVSSQSGFVNPFSK